MCFVSQEYILLTCFSSSYDIVLVEDFRSEMQLMINISWFSRNTRPLSYITFATKQNKWTKRQQ